MNESVKTLLFVAIAVVVCGAAWLNGPRDIEQPTAADLTGTDLIKQFDPLSAASIEIVEFDEANAAVKPFRVERKKVKDQIRWVIPSHQDYPTDAQNQLSDAAAAVMGLPVLDVVGESAAAHAEFGVLDPDPKVRKPGDRGVGKRVVLRDEKGSDLAALIIGKAVPDRPELRYVRRVGDDRVCVVKLSVDKISADFEKWIEKDLLKLNPWDITTVHINDYRADLLRQRLEVRGRMTLAHDDAAEKKWQLVSDATLDPDSGQWKETPLADDEELDTQKLDAMKTALDDLKIVDVERKPEGLSADLKATGDAVANEESLVARGFVIADVGEGKQVYSSRGEIRVGTKEGVEYVLRFGEVTGEESKKERNEKKEGDTEQNGEKKDESSPGMNRYLFVMAQFNQDLIERPKLEDEPPVAAAEPASSESKPADAQPGDATKPNAGTAEKPVPAASGSADQPPKESTTTDSSGAKPDEEKTPSVDKQPGSPGEDAPKAEPASTDAPKPADAKPADTQPGDAKPAGDQPAQAGAVAPAADPNAAERERIRTENKRKMEEYEDRVKRGKEKAKELNDRFADWYYVISNSEFEKIHLTREQIVKKKEAKAEGKEGDDHDHPHGEMETFDAMRSSGPGGK